MHRTCFREDRPIQKENKKAKTCTCKTCRSIIKIFLWTWQYTGFVLQNISHEDTKIQILIHSKRCESLIFSNSIFLLNFICCALFEYPRAQTIEDLEGAFSNLESPNTLFNAVFSCSSTYPLSLNLAFIISTFCTKDWYATDNLQSVKND